MKKLLLVAVSLLAVSNAFGWFGGCRNSCKSSCGSSKTENVGTTCEEKPVCYKMVRKECPPKKVCETTCHFVCPPDTIREDGRGEE